MHQDPDYINDIAAIRSMMERSSRFLSLSGWAGVMAGLYALTGAYIVHMLFGFNPPSSLTVVSGMSDTTLQSVIAVAMAVLLLSLFTAAILSRKRALRKGESISNSTSRRMMLHMAAPLVSGGLLVLILLTQGLIAFAAPLTLLFYGLSLFSASQFTYNELRYLGILLIASGLASAILPAWGILFWAFGFGLLHIIYGVFIHMKYER